jgi:hypothetical protein
MRAELALSSRRLSLPSLSRRLAGAGKNGKPRLGPRLVPENLRELIARHWDLPRDLQLAVFPTPRHCGGLHSLGLRARTLHVLEKYGYAVDPRKLGQLTLGETLQFAAFGIGSAVDLAETLHRFNRSKPARAVLPRNLLAMVAGAGRVPRSLLHCRLPKSRAATQLMTLGVKTTTLKALAAAGYSENVSVLSTLTASEALQIPGMGTWGLIDLVEALYRAAGPDQTRLTLRHARTLRNTVGRGSPQILAMVFPDLPKGTSLYDLPLASRTFSALERAGYTEGLERLNGLTVRELLKICRLPSKGIADLFQAIDQYRKRPIEAKSKTLDELVLERLAPRGDSRDRNIVAQYFGLGGQSSATLMVVGRRTRLTGERIRQICAARIGQLTKLRETPVVQTIQRAMQSLLPCRPAVMLKDLVTKGLLHPNTTFRTLLSVLTDIGCGPCCALIGRGDQEIVVAQEQLALAKRIRTFARAEARMDGCCRFASTIGTVCAETNASQKLAKAVIPTLSGFRWLGANADWFWVQTAQPGRLEHQIAKALAVSGTISFEHLREALHKGSRRRLRTVPPVLVLRMFCDEMPQWHVEGNELMASDFQQDGPMLETREADNAGRPEAEPW